MTNTLSTGFLATSGRRKILFAALYLSEGAPIGFLWWALPTQLRLHGLPIDSITLLLSLLAVPWALKFLWAPLVDVFRRGRFGLRAWILGSQLLMGLSLLPLLWIDAYAQFHLLLPVFVVHAFAAATQDVSIDALCIRNTTEAERGSVNGWMQVGMLTGRALFGGASLMVAQSIGEDAVVVLLIAAVWGSSVLVWMSREEHRTSDRAERPWLEFLNTLKRAAGQRSTWRGLAFAVLAGAGYEAAGAVAGPYLVDRGFAADSIGLFFAVVSVIAMGIGALAGGAASDRLGRRRAVGVFLTFFVGALLATAVSDLLSGGTGTTLILVGLSLLYLGIGLFTASSYAWFMDLTDRRLGATQFSAYMGGTNLCESWSAYAAGRLVPPLGYPAAFAVMGVLSLCALPLLGRLTTAREAAERSPEQS